MDRADRFAKAAFALLCIGSLVGFFVYPTYPNYDSYYSLLWGREVLDLQAADVRGLPRADRAPAGDRRRRGAEPARRRRRPRLGRADHRELPVAGRRRLPARADRVHAAGRRDRRRAAADPLRLRVPDRARLHRHPLHGDGRVGGGAGGAAPARAARPCSCCSRWRACCGPRRGCWRRCTGAGSPGRRAGGSGRCTPCSPPRARCCGPRRTTPSPATRCSRCTTRAPRRRSWAATCRCRSCRPRSRSSSPTSSSCRCSSRPCSASRSRSWRCRGAPPRRCALLTAGIVTFVLIGIAGASAIERYLAVAARRAAGVRRGRRSAASRCSSAGRLRTRLDGRRRSSWSSSASSGRRSTSTSRASTRS